MCVGTNTVRPYIWFYVGGRTLFVPTLYCTLPRFYPVFLLVYACGRGILDAPRNQFYGVFGAYGNPRPTIIVPFGHFAISFLFLHALAYYQSISNSSIFTEFSSNLIDIYLSNEFISFLVAHIKSVCSSDRVTLSLPA